MWIVIIKRIEAYLSVLGYDPIDVKQHLDKRLDLYRGAIK